MKKFTQRFLRDNKGVTAIEYGLIAGLMAASLVIAVGSITGALQSSFAAIALLTKG